MKLNLSSVFAMVLGFAALFGSSANAAPTGQFFDGTHISELDKRSAPIPWDQIQILDFVYGGSGCPAGTAAWSISPDKSALTIIYDNFIASVGPNVSYVHSRQFCQLSVKMKFPQGLTFSVTELDTRGMAKLDAGVKGSHTSTFYFSGESQQAHLRLNFQAPYDDDYLLVTKLEDSQLVWHPCGGANRNLQIKESIQVSNAGFPDRQGLLTIDTNDLKVTTIFNFKWKWCQA